MALIRTAIVRPRAALLGQLGLSITATVAATLIVSAIQHGITAFPSVRSVPQLTSGGKFAARIEALRTAADDRDDTVPAPPRVPLLVADPALQAVPIHLANGSDAVGAKPSAESGRPPKRLARAENRRRMPADAAADVLPPRRSDNIVAVVGIDARTGTASDTGGVWSTTKGLYKQAVWLGGSVIDHVNPLNLLP